MAGKAPRTKTKRDESRLKPKDASTKSSIDKWQIVENVITAFEKIRATVPGTKITPKAPLPSLHEADEVWEVDVLVEIPASGRTLRVGVDVKHEGRPLTRAGMAALVAMRNATALTHYCVVSTSGYVKAAAAMANRSGIEALTLREFTVEDMGETSMVTVIREFGRVISAQFQYSADELDGIAPEQHVALTGAALDEVTLRWKNGTSDLLSAALYGTGSRHLNSHLSGGNAGDTAPPLEFGLALDTNLLREVVVAGHTIPAPRMILARYRIDRTSEHVREHLFELSGIGLRTCVIDDQQHTLAFFPGDSQSDLRIGIAVSEAKPVKSKRLKR